MPRRRSPFSLISRPSKSFPSGKVWYAVYYDLYGMRRYLSTDTDSKTNAWIIATEWYRQGRFSLNTDRRMLPFGKYFSNFWDEETSDYIRMMEEKDIKRSKSTFKSYRSVYEKHLAPFFGKMFLPQITPLVIEKWQLQKKKEVSNTTCNYILAILSVMLTEAVRRGDIDSNPCEKVRRLGNDTRIRGTLTPEEVKKLFSSLDNWKGDEIAMLANLLAACTGMRIGEVQGVTGEKLMENYILVDQQFSNVAKEVTQTKTGDVRKIPLPESLMKSLKALRFKNPRAFIFSHTDGTEPISKDSLGRSLYSAMRAIGISDEERKGRNITFHSWRHYMASQMANSHINAEIRKKITGHASDRMLEHYTHLDVEAFAEVLELSEKTVGKLRSEKESLE